MQIIVFMPNSIAVASKQPSKVLIDPVIEIDDHAVQDSLQPATLAKSCSRAAGIEPLDDYCYALILRVLHVYSSRCSPNSCCIYMKCTTHSYNAYNYFVWKHACFQIYYSYILLEYYCLISIHI